MEGGYVADTPGFSTMDIERYELFRKEELPEGFREFAPYLGECKFTSCSHTCEKGCAVLKAAEEEKISRSRIDSYIAMYNDCLLYTSIFCKLALWAKRKTPCVRQRSISPRCLQRRSAGTIPTCRCVYYAPLRHPCRCV